MKQIYSGLLAGVLVASSLPAFADHEGGHWEGREIHRFGDRDMHMWRGVIGNMAITVADSGGGGLLPVCGISIPNRFIHTLTLTRRR